MQKSMANYNTLKKKNKVIKYADSFVNNAIDSVPILLSITAVSALMNKKARDMNFKQSFKYSFKSYFVPVLIASSAFFTFFDNKKNEK